MVLLNDVVQIFTLANFDTFVFVAVVLFDASCIGSAFIDVDQAGFTVGTDGFVQKTQRCLLVTLVCQ